MIDTNLIDNKIKFIRQDLEMLSEFKNFSFDQIAKDQRTHLITERLIERIVNEAIDINQHIVVEKDLLDKMTGFASTFILLGELEILPKNFAKKISKSVHLRNILVHHYQELDEDIFYKSIQDCLQDYTDYCEYILKFIDTL